MQNKAKVAAGSAAVLAILIAGGLAIALPAQASTNSGTSSVVEPSGTNDGETADDAGVESGTNDGETADDTGTENTNDDVNGVAVEDGTQD